MTYNTAPVSIDMAYDIAVGYMEVGIVPLFIAPPGVGKTMLATRLAEHFKAELRPLRLNNTPPEEAIGLQFIDSESRSTIHLAPRWLPAENGSDGPVVIFLDEITQASDENRKGVFSLFNERYLGDRKLPDNCWIVAAGNSAEDGTNVYELDRATASRFGIIRILPDVESWSNDYARFNDIDLSIVSFLRVRHDCFEMSEKAIETDSAIAASPRTWEKVNPLIKRHRAAPGVTDMEKVGRREILRHQLGGLLGEEVANSFMSVYEEVASMTALADLLGMTSEERRKAAPVSMEGLWLYAQSAIWYATDVERIREVFSLFDDFRPVGDMPFYETRYMVAETIMKRATFTLKIPGDQIFKNPHLQPYAQKWKKETLDPNHGEPDVRAAGNDGSPVEVRQAA